MGRVFKQLHVYLMLCKKGGAWLAPPFKTFSGQMLSCFFAGPGFAVICPGTCRRKTGEGEIFDIFHKARVCSRRDICYRLLAKGSIMTVLFPKKGKNLYRPIQQSPWPDIEAIVEYDVICEAFSLLDAVNIFWSQNEILLRILLKFILCILINSLY